MKLFTAPPLSHLSPPAAGEMPRERRIACLPSAPSQLRLMPIARLAQGGRWRIEAMRSLSEPCLLWFTRGQGRITVGGVTRGYGVHTVASLNSIMVDATGMCGACMVPFAVDGKMVRKHACIDGPELDAHAIDWDKFLPRFNLFKAQEAQSKARHGYA